MNAPPNPQMPVWARRNEADPLWLSQGRAWEPDIVKMKQEAFHNGYNAALMLASGSTRGSIFYNYENDLKNYGWSLQVNNPHAPVTKSELDPFQAAFEALGIRYQLPNPHWLRICVVHDNGDQHKFPSNHALYEILVNFHQGVIVTLKNVSPSEQNDKLSKHDKRKKIPEKNIVPFGEWSDVMFHAIYHASMQLFGSPDGIRFIKHVSQGPMLDEDESRMCAVVSEDSTNPHRFASKFPGRNFTVNGNRSFQALATLGMHYSFQVAKMFATHKAQIGDRQIDYVNLFNAPVRYGKDEQREDEDDDDFEARTKAKKWAIYLHLSTSRAGLVN